MKEIFRLTSEIEVFFSETDMQRQLILHYITTCTHIYTLHTKVMIRKCWELMIIPGNSVLSYFDLLDLELWSSFFYFGIIWSGKYPSYSCKLKHVWISDTCSSSRDYMAFENVDFLLHFSHPLVMFCLLFLILLKIIITSTLF